MAHIAAQCVFPYASGLPTDVQTNTFHFDIVVADPTPQLAAITAALTTFYDQVHAAPGGWANYIVWTSAHVNYYFMDSPLPRIPITHQLDMTTVSAASSLIPAEACVAMSFHGSALAGEVPARRRGRVYLGGFALLMTSSSLVTPPRLDSTIVNNIQNAGEVLMNSLNGPEVIWCVWSQVNSELVPVEGGWVDNEPDTQRRRGIKATVRNTWP